MTHKASNADYPRQTFATRIDPELLARLRRMAKLTHRSRNNYVEAALIRVLEEDEQARDLAPVTASAVEAEVKQRKGRA